jgi:hypothetical protein
MYKKYVVMSPEPAMPVPLDHCEITHNSKANMYRDRAITLDRAKSGMVQFVLVTKE